MSSKLIGGILLIVGTTIGAGMLALPIATAQLGFLGSLVLLLACWVMMTSSAFLLMEANLCLPLNSNLISMSKATLGRYGEIVSWLVYLLLLYSLLCAYIAGGSDLLRNLLKAEGVTLASWSSSVLFTLLFGSIVYLGIRSVDYVNRGLMFVKLGAYLIVIILLMPFVAPLNLSSNDYTHMTSSTAIMVTITSFGFAIIIPSLRVYLGNDVKKLKLAILIGSLIPLICYIAWDLAIMGIIPLQGNNGLMSMLHSGRSTSDLVNTLSSLVHYNVITWFTKLFTSICVLTSFLGVSLCLTDFLADGFKVEKKGWGNLIIFSLAFLPALGVVLVKPSIFIKALEYAGIYCVILLVVLPVAMVWRGRYHQEGVRIYQVGGGKWVLIGLMGFAVYLVGRGFLKL